MNRIRWFMPASARIPRSTSLCSCSVDRPDRLKPPRAYPQWQDEASPTCSGGGMYRVTGPGIAVRKGRNEVTHEAIPTIGLLSTMLPVDP